jgi:hypothetical protein
MIMKSKQMEIHLNTYVNHLMVDANTNIQKTVDTLCRLLSVSIDRHSDEQNYTTCIWALS